MGCIRLGKMRQPAVAWPNSFLKSLFSLKRPSRPILQAVSWAPLLVVAKLEELSPLFSPSQTRSLSRPTRLGVWAGRRCSILSRLEFYASSFSSPENEQACPSKRHHLNSWASLAILKAKAKAEAPHRPEFKSRSRDHASILMR